MSPRPVKNEIYAPNHEIMGEYDKTLSAKCENGTFVGYLDDGVLTFKGIPFAAPPVGKLRWKLPQPVAASDKVFEAYHSCKTSIQPVTMLDKGLAYEMGEDCLCLNIYNNFSDKTEKKAVMVWIHGGEYLSGGNSSPAYDGYNFAYANSDVILVTINYRLGIMGFVDFSKIEGGENYPDVNLGIYDQVEALRWVKKNIAAFGGDPDCITIFGESAGGGSVATLCTIKETKGLFKRAIMESGAVCQAIYKDNAALPACNLAKAVGAKNMDDLLAIPEDKIREYWQTGSEDARDYIVMDGRLFEKEPYELWDEGVTKDLELLQGFMADEWRIFSGSIRPKDFFDLVNKDVADRLYESSNDEFKRLYDEYKELMKDKEHPAWPGVDFMSERGFQQGTRRQIAAHAENGGRGYAYIMDVPSAIPGMGACHITDIAYVFGNLNGQLSKDGPEDWELSGKIQKMWTNFAKTGDPSTDEIKWPEYDLETRKTMMLTYDVHVESDPWKEKRILLEKMGKENPEFYHSKTFPEMTKDTLEHYPQFKQK